MGVPEPLRGTLQGSELRELGEGSRGVWWASRTMSWSQGSWEAVKSGQPGHLRSNHAVVLVLAWGLYAAPFPLLAQSLSSEVTMVTPLFRRPAASLPSRFSSRAAQGAPSQSCHVSPAQRTVGTPATWCRPWDRGAGEEAWAPATEAPSTHEQPTIYEGIKLPRGPQKQPRWLLPSSHLWSC